MIGIKVGSFSSMISYGEKKQQSDNYQCNVLLSKSSKRTIPTLLTYLPNNRVIGEEAKIYYKRYHSSTFTYINRLISLSKDSEFGKKELDLFFKDKTFNDDYSFDYEIEKEKKNIKIDEIVYTFIKKLFEYFIISENKTIEKIITNIPDHFTIHQINHFYKLLEIAEIKSKLLIESAAITLYYAYSKYNDLFYQGDICKYVIFVDMGHSKVSFIFSKFTHHYCEILFNQTINFLGGRNIDNILIKYFNQKFKELNNKEFIQNKKAVIKIMEEIEKIKQNLSVSSEFLINIDAFIDNIDFIYQFKKEDIKIVLSEFISEFSKKFSKFYHSCVNLLQENEGISFIELISDLTRIIFIENEIKKISKMPISRTISCDECVAVGNSFYCLLEEEKLSNKYIYSIYRRAKYSLSYKINDKEDITLLNKNQRIPFNYYINLILDEYKKLSILIKYDTEEVKKFISSNEIIQYDIKIPDIRKKYKTAIQMTICLFININEEIELKYIHIIKQNGELIELDKTYVKSTLKDEFIDLTKTIFVQNENQLNKNDIEYREFLDKKDKLMSRITMIKNKLKNHKNLKYQGEITYGEYLNIIIKSITEDKDIENNEFKLNQLINDYCEFISKIYIEKDALKNKIVKLLNFLHNNYKNKEKENEIKQLNKLLDSLKDVIHKDELNKLQDDFLKIEKQFKKN